MTAFKGLVFVRQGAIGTKSEGPDYFLQTKNHEYLLKRKTEEHHWNPDYLFEYYSRRWVEIDGSISGTHLIVESIHEICVDRMPA